MTQVQPGDLIFSFSDTFIKAVGVATDTAATAPKPTEFGSAGANWDDTGWFVPVDFSELKTKVRPKDHIEALRPTLPDRYSPLQANGNGNQTVYLAEVPEPMAAVLMRLLGDDSALIAAAAVTAIGQVANNQAEISILSRSDIPQTTKEQLIRARRGQGMFRSRVELIERGCRVTRLSIREHLRASHIKPWRDSTDSEKLDGANGLLLAPHIDHLFDRGYITFENDGNLLISPQLESEARLALGIPQSLNVGAFSAAQQLYLEHHREQVYLR